jgi:hypothetical protein
MSDNISFDSYVCIFYINQIEYINKFTLNINIKGNIYLYYSYYENNNYHTITSFQIVDNLKISKFYISKIEFFMYLLNNKDIYKFTSDLYNICIFIKNIQILENNFFKLVKHSNKLKIKNIEIVKKVDSYDKNNTNDNEIINLKDFFNNVIDFKNNIEKNIVLLENKNDNLIKINYILFLLKDKIKDLENQVLILNEENLKIKDLENQVLILNDENLKIKDLENQILILNDENITLENMIVENNEKINNLEKDKKNNKEYIDELNNKYKKTLELNKNQKNEINIKNNIILKNKNKNNLLTNDIIDHSYYYYIIVILLIVILIEFLLLIH